MKFEDYKQIETAIQEAYERLLDVYESCDTSYSGDKFETESDIEEWNKDFNLAMETLQSLKEQMIFTFKVED